ncbi:flagellin N-terminal helical domain-containing protein [Rhodoplanes sp. Z2-YC6860]|uniref:flagellin N-terminal helical domain-containing protein n=1 Tax=Rhodoplanes sp. Z2-YC6860 TaxID=674703 RepID=UPI00078C0CBE|nr:flagellin [Rhodoplanes sp. Z2-YC6860]AMN43316.1 flagellin domain-containing protein [Rhodoplanes sp. Z2-YC6860]
MSSDIVLTAGVRANLLQLQKTSDLITATQTKLATGKRVNSALDNPVNYFTAQGLQNRAGDLGNLLDSMGSAFNTIQAANNGITSITKLVQSAQALVSQAQQTSDTAVRAGLASQFDAILTQIGTLASDSGFNGINLLDKTNSADLTVTLNESGTSTVTISAVDFSANGLSINNSLNSWGTTSDISTASTDLTNALTTLRSQAQALGSNLTTVQVRQDFTKAMINTLQSGADSLTLADSNEEGANLLALQTRQQLSTTALSLASQASQAVLRLFQ